MRFPKKVASLEKITLLINGHKIRTEVARTDEEKEHGLMGRKDLGPRDAMLFIEDSRPSLWMKDTPTALSAAWVSAKGKILGIVDMEPLSEEIYVSPLHTHFAIEMRQGAFAALGIERGAMVIFPLGFQVKK
jgi:hypothetical protein